MNLSKSKDSLENGTSSQTFSTIDKTEDDLDLDYSLTPLPYNSKLFGSVHTIRRAPRSSELVVASQKGAVIVYNLEDCTQSLVI